VEHHLDAAERVFARIGIVSKMPEIRKIYSVLDRKPMGDGTKPKTPIVVEIDKAIRRRLNRPNVEARS
jgi:hypothetical protein